MPGVASAATAVMVGYIAGGTERIRVGAGGVMLANHSPLVVAEQFGTLGSLFPARIDLGIGRASGADRETIRALQRHPFAIDRFTSDVDDLIAYLWDPEPRRGIRAIPGNSVRVPIWILGSSTTSAALAAASGRPFAFASHFAPNEMMRALDTYRTTFQPSEQLAEPYVMLGFNAIVAEDECEARLLASSMQRGVLAIRNGHPEELQPPTPDYESSLSWADKGVLAQVLRYSSFGCPSMVRQELLAFVELTDADEVIISSPCFDHGACLRSFALLAEACDMTARPDAEAPNDAVGPSRHAPY